MLKFVTIPSKNRFDVMLGVIRIAELNYLDRWDFTWFNNHEILRSEELRQIADKLDELNKV